MKHVTFFFFAIFILQNTCLMAQNAEQCNSIIKFNDDVLFDTTAMFCQTVWTNKDYILRYAQTGSELWSFLLSAPNTNSWLGIGFSTTGQMVGSSAMVGWIYQNGTAIVKQYYLQAKDPDGVTPDAGELNVKMNTTTVFIRSNRLYLAFQINTSQPPKHLLYAVGQYNRLPVASDGLKLLQHREQESASLDYSTGKSETRSIPYTAMKRTHGALNMIGWEILMPIGAIAARYFRQWDPIWFYSHAIIQIFAFLFGLVGFILGLVLEGFINAEITHHKNLGILILILGCLQVMAVLIRPKKGTKLRKYWNWYHHNAGRILIILAISNIFYGIHLGMEGSSWYSTYAVILALMLILAIVLEIRLCRQT